VLVTRNKRLRNKRRLAKGEVTICVGSISKVDLIKHRTLPLPSGSVLNLNNYLVFALSRDMIGLCLSQYGYSFKENNGYSVYLNNTFNGLAPKMNGLLNPDRSDTHVHAKRYKIVMIVPHTCGTAI
jgi:hypothetical protein